MKRNILLQKMIILLLIYSPIITIISSNNINNYSATVPNSDDLLLTEKIVQESFVGDYFIPLSTHGCYRNSIVQFNVTVLPQSNTSVEIFVDAGYAESFSPTLANTTLSPGESFAENYTFVVGLANEIEYFCRCIDTDSNATVRWWYEVLYSAKPEGIGIEFPIILGGLVLFSLGVRIISIKKHYRKND